MDMRKHTEGLTGIGQFCPPMCYELVGKSFYIWMDDGVDCQLDFKDEKRVLIAYDGGEAREASYLCAKGDDTTYLVSCDFEGGRENHTFVIDLENWLATRIAAAIGENKRYPYLITPKYEFGMIRRDGVEYVSYPRHGFTSDVVGNVVQWNYGQMETVHIYYCTNYYRITYPPERESASMFNDVMSGMPSSDEPAAYIKIKDGMYLLSLTEQNLEKLAADKFPFRSNTMCMLQNYKRVYQIGRTFGTMQEGGEDIHLHVMFGAFGKLRDIDEKFLTDPNPFIV